MHFKLDEFQGKRTISVEITGSDEGILMNFDLLNLQAIDWPSFESLRRKDEIWRDTCFECFLGQADSAAYLELNISPSGAWNCYAFDDYRQGMRPSDLLTLDRLDSSPRGLAAHFSKMTPSPPGPCYFGPAAVIRDRTGDLAYFALAHGKKPDFHDRSLHVLADIDHL